MKKQGGCSVYASPEFEKETLKVQDATEFCGHRYENTGTYLWWAEQWPLKDVHNLISGTHDYATYLAKEK